MKKLIIKSNDYGMAFYDEQGNPLHYQQDGNCPVTFMKTLGKLAGFEVEYKGEMTREESESFC